jgi:hypothetical protein
MEPNLEDKPDIQPRTLRDEERERKAGGGFLSGLLEKLGLGGSGEGLGASSASGLAGGLLATKTGVIAVLLAGTTVAAGIGMLGSTRFFSRYEAPAPLRFTPSGQGSGAQASSGDSEPAKPDPGGASASLNYLAQANPAPREAEVPAAGEGVQADGAADAPAGAQAASHEAESSPAPHAAAAPRPAMVRSQGFSGTSSSGGIARLEAQGGMAGGIGGGFQNVYRGAAGARVASASTNRAMMGASRLSSLRTPSGAARQLAQTQRVVRSNLGSSQVSSPGSGLTYDGAAGSVGTPGTGASGVSSGGTGTGGAGVGTGPGASTAKDIREVSTPAPAVGETSNKTPYQKYMYIAIGALVLGLAALLLAGHFAKKAHAGDPTSWGPAKILSGIATACGLLAAGLGVMLMAKWGQTAQGMMFALSGGILTYQAAKALMDAFSSEEAQAKIAAEKSALGATTSKQIGAPAPEPAQPPTPAPEPKIYDA